MRTKFFTISKYIILLVITAFLLFLAFRGIDIRKLLKDIFQANMFWIALSAILSIIAFVSRAYRWKLLIEPMGYSPTLKKTTYSLMVGYFANLAFPRLGEVSRCGALSKAENIPFNKLLGTVIVERVIDVLSLLICMLLAAIIEFRRLGNFFTENIIDPLISRFHRLIESPLLISVVIAGLILLIAIFTWFVRKEKNKKTGSAFSKLVKGFFDGLRSVGQLKNPGAFIFHSVLLSRCLCQPVCITGYTGSWPGGSTFFAGGSRCGHVCTGARWHWCLSFTGFAGVGAIRAIATGWPHLCHTFTQPSTGHRCYTGHNCTDTSVFSR
jgi:uncharacterized membrane protein YbhN (UPF0104 family)